MPRTIGYVAARESGPRLQWRRSVHHHGPSAFDAGPSISRQARAATPLGNRCVSLTARTELGHRIAKSRRPGLARSGGEPHAERVARPHENGLEIQLAGGRGPREHARETLLGTDLRVGTDKQICDGEICHNLLADSKELLRAPRNRLHPES
jgi:hypothetical protein